MANVAAAISALVIATGAGTTLTVGLYSARWGPPNGLIGAYALVATGHLLLCGAYAIMGESMIEDAVKSGVFAACGAVLLFRLPLLGLFVISAATWALMVNQGLRLVFDKQGGPNSIACCPGSAISDRVGSQDAEPGGHPDRGQVRDS